VHGWKGLRLAERFTGTFEELKEKLRGIPGKWNDLNPSQKQLRATSGGILNWYPATGSIMFQGKSPGLQELQAYVVSKLADRTPETAPVATGGNRIGAVAALSAASDVPIDAQPPVAAAVPGRELDQPYSKSEIIIGLIGAVGTELEKVRGMLKQRLERCNYRVVELRITESVIPLISEPGDYDVTDHFARTVALMDAGDKARKVTGNNGILALGAAALINASRQVDNGEPLPWPRTATIISSLKHPAEVEELRKIYPLGFYLVGVQADERRRFEYLTKTKGILRENANNLIERDQDAPVEHGQKVTDTFHLSDFFVRIDGDDDRLRASIERIVNLIFGNPYVTPTFDEYAMFLAFAASLRSADLSRQVGAVVAVDEQVVGTGANDCPKAGGGLYWPAYNPETHEIQDQQDGRDYMRGEDSNKIEQGKIIDEIVKVTTKAGLDESVIRSALSASRIRDLTEFGRVVHAEMEALLSCGRARVPVKDGTVYSTTFPCHNCAKHIIAAGIKRVVFIEPYQKSKAEEFHSDSIEVGFVPPGTPTSVRPTVRFEPFVGVGPRRFFDLFSIRLGSGRPLKRKDSTGSTLEWKPESSNLRLQMLPFSYLRLEYVASDMFDRALTATKEKKDAN